MRIQVGFDITVQRHGPCALILALGLRPEEEPRVEHLDALVLTPGTSTKPYIDSFGNRRLRIAEGTGPQRMQWNGVVQDDGLPDQLDPFATGTPVYDLPQDVLEYLAPSRYCQSDLMMAEAWQRFGHIPAGWPRVKAVCDFVHQHIEFGYGYARPDKSAVDAFHETRGVCRDYAHLTITFCRALNIPARYVSGYLGDIGVPYAGPGDFCAWVEVFVGGVWRTVDARHNTPRIGRVKMVQGRDAVDVPMITSFGTIEMQSFTVWCDELAEDRQSMDQAHRRAG